jgi:hypothetical protein
LALHTTIERADNYQNAYNDTNNFAYNFAFAPI